MFCRFTVLLLMMGTLVMAEEPAEPKLAAPEGWGGETIQLPPGFARDMKFKGAEHIRFAPGMMNPASDSFFSYAFVFELQPLPTLSADVVQQELLKYYRGLCVAVLSGQQPEVAPADFTLSLRPVKGEGIASAEDSGTATAQQFTGTLRWVEPFATKKLQQLNLEIWTWNAQDRGYLFACVSPQRTDAPIWTQLRKIRDDYVKR